MKNNNRMARGWSSIRRLGPVSISVAVHVAAFALLLLVRMGEGPAVQQSPLIMAELITSLAPETPAPVGPAPSEAVAPPTPSPEPETPLAPETRVETAPTPELAPERPEPEPALETPAPTIPEPAGIAPPPEPALNAEADEGAASDASVADTLPEATPAVPPAAERPPETRADQALRKRLASWTGEFKPDEPEPKVTWREAGQQYTAVMRRMPATDAMGMERLVVAVTTERDGEPFATELTMTRLAFSNFGQFIDKWDPEVGLHEDVIDGRFHSNSVIRVDRSSRVLPTFNGKVTLAAGEIDSEGPGFLSKRKLFPAGYEMNVRHIGLPKRGTTIQALVLPTEQVQRFEHDADVVFHWDGSFVWRPLEGTADGERRTLGEEPFYLLAADDVTLHVSGVVNGKVLVYSPASIVIADDLTYADNPMKDGASDYLGLVADRTIEIAGPDVTGEGDLTIHASMYARTRFAVRDFLSRRSGTLAIVGSVTAGTASATEPRYGTVTTFDQRLVTMRAPGFPLTDRYELDQWNGEWRPVEQ
jgi:hypothetical protein